MPRLSAEALEAMLKLSKREGYVLACLETGPKPANAKQEEHFLRYYEAKALIVIP